MLVLSRKVNQEVVIGKDIVLTITEIRGDKVRIGVKAPRDVPVHRREIQRRIEAEGSKASGTPATAEAA